MASKPCDDPMDLGPFLQNYVLRNPFHEFMLGSGQLPEDLPKPKESRTIRKVLLASSIDGSQSGIDSASGPSVSGRSTKRITKQDDDGSCDGSSSGHAMPRRLFVTSVESSCLDLAGSGLTEVVERAIKQEVDVVDGGCGGVDELGFMNSTTGLQDILSDYPEVHQWLCSNFKYLSRYHNCLTSAKILLHKVQRTFPHITKVVLGQLILAAYPCCPKLVQEGETFYQGLVPKLAESILENATSNFMTALENVTKGLMNLQEAAEKFNVSEMALKSVLMWDKVDLAVNGINSTEVSSVSLSSSRSRANGTTHKKSASSREHGKESRIRVASTRTSIRHRAIKRARFLSVSTNSSIAPLDSNDDSIDFETMLQNIQGESSASALRRAIIHTPSSDVIVDRHQSSPDDDTRPLSVKEELPEDTSETRTEQKTRNSGRSRPLSSAIGDAVAKATPGCSNGSTEPSSPVADRRSGQSSSSSVRSTRFLEQRRKKASVLVTGGGGGSPVSDVDRRFVRVQQDLASCQGANLKLRNELESVQSENLLLKEELNTRDFHLVHLAEDFFKLHGQFKLLAEQFQVILNETQNSLSQSLIGHNSR